MGTIAAIDKALPSPPRSRGQSGTWLASLLCAFCAFALGQAILVEHGTYHPAAIWWLTAAIAAGAGVLFTPFIRALEASGERWLEWALALGVTLQLGSMPVLPVPQISLAGATVDGRLVILPAVFFVLTQIGRIPSAYWLLPALCVHFCFGLWLLRNMPEAQIDVFTFQQHSARALLEGVNPYTLTFPDLAPRDSGFYGPGVSVDGRLLFGFPYQPLSLLLVLPGYFAVGDVRLVLLAAVTGSAILMAFARPSHVATLAALLFVLTPNTYFVVHSAWTEPLAIFLVALLAFTAFRAPAGLPLVFGCLLAVKQYMVLLLALAPLVRRALRLDLRAFLLRSLLVAVAVTLPMVLWDIGAYIHSAVVLQFRQPFRMDALSYAVLLVRSGLAPRSAFLGFAVLVPVVVLTLRRLPSTVAAIPAGIGLVYLVFFAFNKQAFCNYYYFVIGALCCSVAVAGRARNV